MGTTSLIPIAFMSDSCPGPSIISVADFDIIALTPGTYYTANLRCVVTLDSGNSSLVVKMMMSTLDTMSNHDSLNIFDGNSTASPRLWSMSGSMSSSGQSYVTRARLAHHRLIATSGGALFALVPLFSMD
jgi:hypothetical protein